MANVKYFKDVETLEDVRVRLIAHLQEIDPKSRKFETMIRQYEDACKKVGEIHENQKGEKYKKAVSTSPEDFALLVMKIMSMQGVSLERVGTWFWASGNTKKYKSELAKMGFWWNRQRTVWQWHDPSEGKYRKSKKSSGLLKAIYGTMVIKGEEGEEVA